MHIVFNEEKHLYTNSNTGEIYTSATQLLSKFKKPFDKYKHSQRVAEREGVTQQEILDRWEQMKDTSIVKGKNIHKLMENYIRFGGQEPGWSWLYSSFEKQREQIFEKYDEIHSELLLYNDEFKIAGTCDGLIESKYEFSIFDFKTNKKLSTSNPFGDYLLYPLDFLQVCEYNVYALQLSLYAYMYEKISGKRVRNLSILYLKNDYLKTFNVPYLKFEVKVMLNHYKQSKIGNE
ncbi:MAG: hypothetical protein EBU90_24555 [Proteobacteria bacterium]|nr:hypothetical protein [Pseudomonadota bacterium]